MGKAVLRRRTTRERESYLSGWLAAAEHFSNNWSPHSCKSQAFTNGVISGVRDELEKLKARRQRIESGRAQ